ncbi:uncharacterized protein LOC143294286 [Babylonia areolata]|uniref:uncharacterized protein LOC143294286 n=1 Tax=Babylonia areolata TaxID=304850 RepID=UPI003FD5F317
MEAFFPTNQVFNWYCDGGASDGSAGMDAYSSSDSTHSGDVALSSRTHSSPSSNGECADVLNISEDFSFLSPYQGFNADLRSSDYCRQVGAGRPESKFRNVSVSSPSPQQVNFTVEPFLHVRPPSPWLGGQRSDVADNAGSPSPFHSRFGHFLFQQPDPWRYENPFEENSRAFSSAFQARSAFRPRLSTCDDPKFELLQNGRDVELDDVDHWQIRQRDSWQRGKQQPVLRVHGGMEDDDRYQELPLKQRLEQVREMIRQENARRAVEDEARGVFGAPRRRRDRTGKKCKFCQKKKEAADIVSHHNLKDGRDNVTCPILQQYRCDLCHATGTRAHTIKYCPLNNPDTPHDVILQARWQVYTRNRLGE